MIDCQNHKIELDIKTENNQLELDLKKEDKQLELNVDNTSIYEKNYEKLDNLPKINGNVLIGNKTSEQLNLPDEMEEISNLEILEIFNRR